VDTPIPGCLVRSTVHTGKPALPHEDRCRNTHNFDCGLKQDLGNISTTAHPDQASGGPLQSKLAQPDLQSPSTTLDGMHIKQD
jgi:hypothetical protein